MIPFASRQRIYSISQHFSTFLDATFGKADEGPNSVPFRIVHGVTTRANQICSRYFAISFPPRAKKIPFYYPPPSISSFVSLLAQP